MYCSVSAFNYLRSKRKTLLFINSSLCENAPRSRMLNSIFVEIHARWLIANAKGPVHASFTFTSPLLRTVKATGLLSKKRQSPVLMSRFESLHVLHLCYLERPRLTYIFSTHCATIQGQIICCFTILTFCDN